MPDLRRASATAIDLTCRAVGRRTVVRAARYVLSLARLDYPNDPTINGEPDLQRWVRRLSPIHVADVGANIGRWSESMLAAATQAGRETDLSLHVVAPAAGTNSLHQVPGPSHTAEHRIAVVQCEYNHRWVYARSFLRDAFEFVMAFGYRIGKLTPRGVEFYPGWDVDLETFVEVNYLACDPDAAAGLPAVAWWKSE
jgi:hypothetical protein